MEPNRLCRMGTCQDPSQHASTDAAVAAAAAATAAPAPVADVEVTSSVRKATGAGNCQAVRPAAAAAAAVAATVAASVAAFVLPPSKRQPCWSAAVAAALAHCFTLRRLLLLLLLLRCCGAPFPVPVSAQRTHRAQRNTP
jgi:hypothetical protein